MSVRLNLAAYAVTGISVALFVTACSDGSSTGSSATPTITTTQTDTITVTASPSDDATNTVKPSPSATKTTPAPKSTFAFDKGVAGLLVRNTDGSEYLVQAKLYPIITNAYKGMKVKKFRLGSACPFNAATDAVIGYTFVVSSHTGGGNNAVWNLDVRTTNAQDSFRVIAETFQTNTGNLNCNGGSTPIYQNGGSFGSDGYRQIYGALIIKDFKTTAHAAAKLARSSLRVTVTGQVLNRQGFGSKQTGSYPLYLN